MRPPDQVGEFVVEERLGEGGMGAVYRVLDPRTGARHALKVLTALHDPEAVQRFVREGEALAAIGDHPNVVRVHAAGASKAGPYLVMQLCTGGDLKGRLRAGPLPPREAARVVLDVARGIAHVHARGIIHRDLKPENVLFDDAGQTRVSDFGLARVAGAGTLTATGTILGTPVYMAPEQVDGAEVDARADVWGLGALLIAALTGRPPYAGASPVNVLAKLLTEPPRWPSVDRPDTPPALEGIVRHAMERRPEDRYPGAAALAADLERFLAGELDPRPASRRRHVALAATGAIGLLLVVAAVAWPEPTTPPHLTPSSPAAPIAPATSIAASSPARSLPPPAAPDWRSRPPERAPLRITTPWPPKALLFLDAEHLLVGGGNVVLLVHAATGRTLSQVDLPGVRTLARAGRQVYAGTTLSHVGGRVHALRLSSPGLSLQADPLPIHFEEKLISIACTSDGEVLAAVDAAGDVHAFSLADGRSLGESFDGPPAENPCLAISSDGRLVACGHVDALSLLSLGGEGLTELRQARTAGSPQSVAFVSDRVVVVGTYVGVVQVLDVEAAGELISLFEEGGSASAVTHAGQVRGLAVIGPTLLSMSGGSLDQDNELRAWELAGGRSLWHLPGRPASIVDLAVAPDGTRCAVSSRVADAGLVEVWAER